MRPGIREIVLAVMVAVLSFGGGLVGALVAQTGENERLEKRTSEEVRGAARILTFELEQAASLIQAMIDSNQLPFPDPELKVSVSNQDLQLVAGRLDGLEEYDPVFDSLEGLQAFERYAKSQLLRPRTARRLRPIQRRNLKKNIVEIGLAVNALQKVADTEGRVFEVPQDYLEESTR